jgi:hypothetical protein
MFVSTWCLLLVKAYLLIQNVEIYLAVELHCTVHGVGWSKPSDLDASQGAPWQQFSVKKPNTPFICSKSAL